MRLKHKFISHTGLPFYDEGHEVKSYERYISGDTCIFCGLEVTLKNMFLYFNDSTELLISKNKFESKFPCLTEEEFIVKNLLE